MHFYRQDVLEEEEGMLPYFSADIAFILYSTVVLLTKALWWLVNGITVSGITYVPAITQDGGLAWYAANLTYNLLNTTYHVLYFFEDFGVAPMLAKVTRELVNFIGKVLANLAAFG